MLLLLPLLFCIWLLSVGCPQLQVHLHDESHNLTFFKWKQKIAFREEAWNSNLADLATTEWLAFQGRGTSDKFGNIWSDFFRNLWLIPCRWKSRCCFPYSSPPPLSSPFLSNLLSCFFFVFLLFVGKHSTQYNLKQNENWDFDIIKWLKELRIEENHWTSRLTFKSKQLSTCNVKSFPMGVKEEGLCPQEL